MMSCLDVCNDLGTQDAGQIFSTFPANSWGVKISKRVPKSENVTVLWPACRVI